MKELKQQKKLLGVLLYSVVAFSLQAQQPFKAPEIAPTAPSVASQLKYVETPVTNYNGTSGFSLPLYELKERDITLPISLYYYSNGLKTDEEASWVGLGWNLNAGGFIQFAQQPNQPATPLAPYGIDLNPAYTADIQTNKLQRGCTYQTPEGNPVSFDNAADVKYYGYQYPLYMYNFNGHSGKFIYTLAGEIINIDKSNISFELLSSPQEGFKATTPDGMQYIFEADDRGRSQRPNYTTPCSGTVMVTSFNISYTYNLTRIISPQNATVTFTYDAITTRSLPGLNQWFTYDPQTSSSGLFNITYSDHQEKILTEINTPTVKIKFVSSSRQDLYQGKKLDRIEVYRQGEATVLKTINLTTDYFTGQGGFGDFLTQITAALGNCGITQPQNFVTDDLKKKRLKLVGVKLNGERPYTFEYSTMPLPYKTSLAKDMWGYFNGIPNNTTLLPDINNLGYYDLEVTPYFSTHLFTGNRKAAANYAQAGMLTKITQPTGGYTRIGYESNVFENLTGTMQLIDVQQTVTDIGSGKDVKTFEVPDIVAYNTYARLTVHLNCMAPQYGCESGNCLGYANGSAGIIGTSDNRLYILLERQNSNGSWSVHSYYDRLSYEMGANCTFDGYINLPGGTYRMTANFPDNMTTGLMGGPWADARLIYKNYNSNPVASNVSGAGLRVASVIDYLSESSKYNEQYFVYGSGMLLTKPDFITVYDSNIQGVEYFNQTSTCTTIISGGEFANCNALTENTRHTETIFSDSVRPYSYNALGALVGYSSVTINYGQNAVNGKEVYEYINNYDNTYYYQGLPSGVSGQRKLDNGKLTKKYTYRNANPLATSPSAELVQSETYEYEVADYKKFWNYIPEYHPTAMLCSGNWQSSTLADMSRCFMHFYPVLTGNVRLKGKLVKQYNTPESGTPSETVNTSYQYSYNNSNQLISEKSSNSSQQDLESKYYYPQEMLALNVQPVQMQELIDNNRIAHPIRTDKLKNSIRISQQQTSYVKDASTGNLLLPKSIFSVKGATGIDISSATGRQLTFTRYDTDAINNVTVGNGRVLEYTQENGIPVSFVWGYDKRFPIAKVEGVPYSTIENLANALQTASNADNDTCITGCNETTLRTALNNFRNNVLLTGAMVTTYTYDPLVGLTSITGPNGLTEYYQYNIHNELIKVIDASGNLLQEFTYRYLGN